MPFQDVDEAEVVEAPRPPSTIERLLRKIFLEDWTLKLVALAITMVVWLAVTSENQPMTVRSGVQINYIKPDNLEISNDPPKSVDVHLTGSKTKLNTIRLLDLVVSIDLRDSKPGERLIRLTPQIFPMQLPEGVRIDSFQPGSIAVRLEPRLERALPVRVQLEGNPASGFEVYRTQPSISAARVRGAASHINDLQSAATETISVEGRQDSFTIAHVAIDIADPKVEVLDPTLDVNVEIGPKRSEKSFDAVKVRTRSGGAASPATVTVTLTGPALVLDHLSGEDITVVVDRSSNNQNTPRLELPNAIQDKVRLVSIKPAIFR
jgi:YbbR domain-containing protein